MKILYTLVLFLIACPLIANPGKSLFLEELGSYVMIPDSKILRLANTDYTIEALIKPYSRNPNYQSAIVTKRKKGKNNGWFCSLIGESLDLVGRTWFHIGGGLNPFSPGNTVVPLNQWTHLAFVYHYKEKQLLTYINGILDKVEDNIPPPNPKSDWAMMIGFDSGGQPYDFHGQIDEVRIWKIARARNQINSWLSSELPPCYYTSKDSGLIAYYQFEEKQNFDIGGDGLCDDIRDLSCYNHHGDMVGSAKLGNESGWTKEIVLSMDNGHSYSLKYGMNDMADNPGDFSEPGALCFHESVGFMSYFYDSESGVKSFYDIKSYASGGAEWRIEAKNGRSGIRISWEKPETDSGSFSLETGGMSDRYIINMKNRDYLFLPEGDSMNLMIHYSPLPMRTRKFNEGWNLFSLPLVLHEGREGKVFQSEEAEVYSYNGGYQQADTILYGKGYWIKRTRPGNELFTGSVPRDTISIKAGWNLVGGFSAEKEISEIQFYPREMKTGPFFGYNNQYLIADALIPGEAYWIYSDSDGEFSSLKDIKEPLFRKNYISNLSDTLYIQGDDGVKFTLLYEENSNSRSGYSFPPLPPASLTDIRFTDDKISGEYRGESEIKMRSVKFPITVSARFDFFISTDSTKYQRVNGERGEEIFIKRPTDKLTIFRSGFLRNNFYARKSEENFTIRFFSAAENKTEFVLYSLEGAPEEKFAVSSDVWSLNEIKPDLTGKTKGVYILKMRSGNVSDYTKIVVY